MKFINLQEKAKLTASMVAGRLINAMRNPARISYQTILIVKDDEIGDMCYALHSIAMLRKQFPQARITLLCREYSKPLIQAGMVNEVVTRWKDLKGRFDLIVELKCSWRSISYSLRQWPKARLDRGTVRFTDALAGKYPHESETNFRVVAPVIQKQNHLEDPRLFPAAEDFLKAEEFMLEHGLNSFALLHISARRELRKWPAARYQQLATYLHDKGLQVVFVGDHSEKAAIDAARAGLGFATYSTSGELSLSALAALMQKAAIYIGNESGPLHMAAIQNIPSLGLYGPGPQHVFYPRGKKSAVLHHVLECNPCDQIHCRYPDNPCINRITLQEVIGEVNRLMNWQ